MLVVFHPFVISHLLANSLSDYFFWHFFISTDTLLIPHAFYTPLNQGTKYRNVSFNSEFSAILITSPLKIISNSLRTSHLFYVGHLFQVFGLGYVFLWSYLFLATFNYVADCKMTVFKERTIYISIKILALLLLSVFPPQEIADQH